MKENYNQNPNTILNLSKEASIKIWIKTLLYSFKVFPNLINTVDKIINLQASSMFCTSDIFNYSKSTLSQIEKVIDMSERKQSLVNIYLMISNIFDSLPFETKEFAEKKFVEKYSNEELSQEYGISIRTVYRKLNKIIDEIYLLFLKKRWTLEFIEMQVNGEDWLIEKYLYNRNDYIKNLKKSDYLGNYSKSSSESYDGNVG